jgi:hypothetical protein
VYKIGDQTKVEYIGYKQGTVGFPQTQTTAKVNRKLLSQYHCFQFLYCKIILNTFRCNPVKKVIYIRYETIEENDVKLLRKIPSSFRKKKRIVFHMHGK